jgi:hypothetical protein
MNELQLKNLWTKLSDKFDIGDYETFKSKMLTKERRKAFYDKISEKFDIGSYDDFEIRLTSGSQQSSLPSGSQPVSVGSQPVSVGSQPVSVGSQPTQIPSELKDIDGVKKFQDWLDIYHPGWHRKYGTLNKNLLRGYGKYGPNTTRAWNNQSYKDEYLKTSNSAATPSSESSSNWMDSFPSCVKGLKGFYNPPNNYFFGFGTDKEGAQYMIGYYSQKFNTGQRCEIYKDGSSVGIGFYSCTTNNQQIIIKTLSGLSITGSVINPDSKDITLPKNDNETLEPSDDDVLKDNKVRVSKNTGI